MSVLTSWVNPNPIRSTRTRTRSTRKFYRPDQPERDFDPNPNYPNPKPDFSTHLPGLYIILNENDFEISVHVSTPESISMIFITC